uniref:Putative secreted protein n=1 Tax=Ixodes ricinus TaxID=34613 RepID=A0A6B0U1E5_IXORI
MLYFILFFYCLLVAASSITISAIFFLLNIVRTDVDMCMHVTAQRHVYVSCILHKFENCLQKHHKIVE